LAEDVPVGDLGLATRYSELAHEMSERIREGVLRPGDRLPSVRSVRRTRKMSPATVLQAYRVLEDRGDVRVRGRSGYYVNARKIGPMAEPAASEGTPKVVEPTVRDVVLDLVNAVKSPDIVALSSAFPDPSLFPLARLARALHAAALRLTPNSIYEDLTPGNPELRRCIARRYMETGVTVPIEEIVVTSGALEALNLCLRTATRPGDIVAIESPAFYAALETIQRLGLRCIEVPTCPREGIQVGALAKVLARHSVKACWLMSNFQNPTGASMPDEKKVELVRLLEKHDVPMIEDDVYAELHFDPVPRKPVKAFDRRGLVMHCSSYSKCLAPGYRVGWASPGRYAKDVSWAKLTFSMAATSAAQWAVVEYLKKPGYNFHLRRLRATLLDRQGRMLKIVHEAFPAGTKVTRPSGGYFLWLELPERVDAMKVYEKACARKIHVAPGPIFSAQKQFRNFIRLNHGIEWSPKVGEAVATVGSIVRSLS
jgi:DNA-binding transcriptional MocR family regulator